MSQNGDTPLPGLVDPFFAAHGYPPSTSEERAEFEVFWAQCQADWRFEIAEGSENSPRTMTSTRSIWNRSVWNWSTQHRSAWN